MSMTGVYTDMVKVGGSVLGIEDGNDAPIRVNQGMFDLIGEEVSEAEGNIVLPTSFAIGRGMIETGMTVRPDESEVPELQRLAAIGQPVVQRLWGEAIKGKTTAELLLTQQELSRKLENRLRVREILRTIEVFFAHGDVPVVNENDAISHEEITFGSNDVLSAMLAAAMQRSGRFGQVRLFMLTDVNGVYRDPEDPSTRIAVIEKPQQYKHLAQGSGSKFTIGGMISKFEAAGIARHARVPSYIYNPADGPRAAAVEGEIGTYFPAWAPLAA